MDQILFFFFFSQRQTHETRYNRRGSSINELDAQWVKVKATAKGDESGWRSCYYVSRWFVSFRYGYCWRNINALSTRYTGQYEQIIAFANEPGLLNVKQNTTIRFLLLDTCHAVKKKKNSLHPLTISFSTRNQYFLSVAKNRGNLVYDKLTSTKILQNINRLCTIIRRNDV